MPVRPDFDPTNLYFITTTTVQRVHLFQRDVIKRIIADSLNYIRSQQWIRLYVFAVMPNHIHFGEPAIIAVDDVSEWLV